MLLSVAEEPTALDLKIASDRFIEERLEGFWDDLSAAVRRTCETVATEYQHNCECDINDHNTRIHVTHSPLVGKKAAIEIRFDRLKKRLLETAEGVLWVPTAYVPEPDFTEMTLRFKRDGAKTEADLRGFTAVQLAQLVVCTHLLKMKLPKV
jgi:hypothetical protein